MLRYILLSIALLVSAPVYADNPIENPFQACYKQLPFGKPGMNWYKVTVICHTGYISFFDTTAKIPTLVSYTLTPFDSLGCANRSDAFVPDPNIGITSQADPKDYTHSSYDKGHIAPDSDMRWDSKVERESFYMTNMTPQLPSFNRGIWKRLETHVRNWAVFRNEDLTIYGGPIYNTNTDKKIGSNVDVPTGFFKIVIDNDSKESIAFKFDDQSTANADKLEDHIVSIKEIETATNIIFPVPTGMDKTTKSEMWLFLKGEYSSSKRKACIK